MSCESREINSDKSCETSKIKDRTRANLQSHKKKHC